MRNTYKIVLIVAVVGLAQVLSVGNKTNLTNYENKNDLRVVPYLERSISEVSLFVSQVHLHPRQEDVFQNILSCIMDKRYIYTI